MATLNEIAWWDWPVGYISEHLDKIVSGDIQALKACAEVLSNQ